MITKKIITIVVIFALASIIVSSNTYQFSLAKSSLDKSKTVTKTTDSSTEKTGHTNTDSKQFQQFVKCLGIIASGNGFATEKEVKTCILLIYDSDSSLSTTSGLSLFGKDNKNK
jgi:hypothetical protein